MNGISEDSHAMTRCVKCQKLVPSHNIDLHNLNCVAAPHVTSEVRQEQHQNGADANETVNLPPLYDNDEVVVRPSAPPEDEVFAYTPPRQSGTTTTTTARERTGQPKNDMEDEVMQVGEFVDLADESIDDVELIENSDVEVIDPPPEDEWPCPRCTLLNPTSVARCIACNGLKSGSEREAADHFTVGDTTLIDDDDDDSAYVLPAGIGSGAILGGLVGGAHAWVNRRPVASGALEGAVSGAVGGALFSEIMRDSSRDATTARGSTAMRRDESHSIPTARVVHGGSAGRRVVYQRDYDLDNGRVRFVRTTRPESFMTSGRSGGGHRMDASLNNEMVMQMLLRSMLQSGGTHQNIDRMSYEQLLEMFGDGSENRGVDASVINTLPSRKIQRRDELPEDKRKCSICLDDFDVGQTVRTLPCLHNFHDKCVDKWLSVNASCPICKHKIGE